MCREARQRISRRGRIPLRVRPRRLFLFHAVSITDLEGVSVTSTATKQKASAATLPKCTTGIQGLDEITGGGLPQGRPTLVCGGAGCGKTLLGIEFIVRGAMLHD